MNLKNSNRENSPPLKPNILKKSHNIDTRQSKQIKLNKNTLRKKRQHSKTKQSIPKNMFRSIHATFDKKQDQKRKKKKQQNRKSLFEFDKMEIIESKEFKQLCNIQNQYRKSLKSGFQQVKWLIPQEQLRRHSFSTFPDYLKEEDFKDLNNLMVNFLHFVCKRRIVRDQEFDFIYQGMLIKFPHRQNQIKRVLIQILNVLES